MTSDPFAEAAEASRALASLTGTERHDAAIVLGTGLAEAAQEIGTPLARVGFCDLPGFPREISAGQRPEILSVPVGGLKVLVFLGRLHLYEGHSAHWVVHPVRTAVLGGCRTVVITNSSGGVREDLTVGRMVLITDHLNLTGVSPLTGLPLTSARFADGAPAPADAFVDLTDAWSARLRSLALEIDASLAQGVYAQLPGPHFETPAEIRMLRSMGADLVGMSSALEVIATRHLGAEVLGVSLVTNPAAGLGDWHFTSGSVASAARGRAAALGRLLRELLVRL